MTRTDQSEAALTWRDEAIPVSSRFDDPYFSLGNGLEETRHVFLRGNDLPARARDGFVIAELGFGTGLNLLATALACPDVALHYTSFEAFPMSAQEMARALEGFPEARAIADPLIAAWGQGLDRFTLGRIEVQVIMEDARLALPQWKGRADAWYLDGFSPAKNPELWGPELMAEVGRHTAPQGSFATYTAAGFVRRALQDAGFEVERVSGFGHKRHMSRGRFAPSRTHHNGPSDE
ncbi:tRNA (5-methylaminomethyl-2-thiouridine)(34)-methyltransferase MnmD [Thioclava sp. GXIMD4216]|uniref:tRNA (5-methylaminomethyl-2-thiouridine)(34)-methyltransferase MnmD n=1 Tax=Thioclava litoralis TaxID=3076557 RepID=A0ABZ1E0K8_9RHOB|nr:tRNA (5-methylaminomethyl-2-thiouridine)(34)-methyltransferase MnmD [Thioclava sp. FTW29]